MRMLLQGMLTGLLVGMLASPARADEEVAETCLRAKVWDGYSQGWAVRTMTSTTLAQGEKRVYLVTLYAGTEYKVLACGDNEAINVDIALYDSQGNQVQLDQNNDREPVVTYRASATDTYYIAVHATKLNGTNKAGIAMAVTYK